MERSDSSAPGAYLRAEAEGGGAATVWPTPRPTGPHPGCPEPGEGEKNEAQPRGNEVEPLLHGEMRQKKPWLPLAKQPGLAKASLLRAAGT